MQIGNASDLAWRPEVLLATAIDKSRAIRLRLDAWKMGKVSSQGGTLIVSLGKLRRNENELRVCLARDSLALGVKLKACRYHPVSKLSRDIVCIIWGEDHVDSG